MLCLVVLCTCMVWMIASQCLNDIRQGEIKVAEEYSCIKGKRERGGSRDRDEK